MAIQEDAIRVIDRQKAPENFLKPLWVSKTITGADSLGSNWPQVFQRSLAQMGWENAIGNFMKRTDDGYAFLVSTNAKNLYWQELISK